VFLGSEKDETIEPWQSALFSFWDTNTTQDNYTMIPMEQQRMYQYDFFGLKTLKESGRLVLKAVPGVEHLDWLFREELFVEYIKPYLN
jgi:hypothetical protein